MHDEPAAGQTWRDNFEAAGAHGRLRTIRIDAVDGESISGTVLTGPDGRPVPGARAIGLTRLALLRDYEHVPG